MFVFVSGQDGSQGCLLFVFVLCLLLLPFFVEVDVSKTNMCWEIYFLRYLWGIQKPPSAVWPEKPLKKFIQSLTIVCLNNLLFHFIKTQKNVCSHYFRRSLRENRISRGKASPFIVQRSIQTMPSLLWL
jgi:hypothetical protein